MTAWVLCSQWGYCQTDKFTREELELNEHENHGDSNKTNVQETHLEKEANKRILNMSLMEAIEMKKMTIRYTVRVCLIKLQGRKSLLPCTLWKKKREPLAISML